MSKKPSVPYALTWSSTANLRFLAAVAASVAAAVFLHGGGAPFCNIQTQHRSVLHALQTR